MRVKTVSNGGWAKSSWDPCPLLALGHGGASLIDKTMRTVQAIFMIAGPTASEMRRFCRSVRGCLADNGVESDIADVPDVIDEFLATNFDAEYVASQIEGKSQRLFEHAIRSPPWNHDWDLIVRGAVNTFLPWFGEWQQHARAMCKFLRVTSWRQSLQRLGSGVLTPAETESLNHFSASFADWRWETLSKVLEEMTGAMVACQKAWDPQKFNFKESDMKALLNKCFTDPGVVRQTAVLKAWLDKVDYIWHWGRGCRCCQHEPGLKRPPKCPQGVKGCRLEDMALKLTTFFEDWAASARDVLE